MTEISLELIKQAVYNLCYQAAVCINDEVYSKIKAAFEAEDNKTAKLHLKNILLNAKTAYENKMPLCQDTGQTIIFMETGQNVHIKAETAKDALRAPLFIEDEINSAVMHCYEENFFRKSIVKNAIFDRTNTKTNTPCTIHTKYSKTDNIKITVMLKGAGSENKSQAVMMLPNSDEDEIIKKCGEIVLSSGFSACPPLFIGIGAGGAIEDACLLSKEALISAESRFSKEETELASKIKAYINDNAPSNFKNCYVLEVKLRTEKTHIACLPLAVTISCHSHRYSSAEINERGVIYNYKLPLFSDLAVLCSGGIGNEPLKEINTGDKEALKMLKAGETVLLTGEIYTARDAAHKKLTELIKTNKPLPFDLKDKILFYAGPCPAPYNKPIGSIGPTTASRMDKYAIALYNSGVYASIGKGGRSREIEQYCLKTGKRYFSMQGGIAALLAQRIKKAEIAAFEELGTEAVYKLYADKMPVTVEY